MKFKFSRLVIGADVDERSELRLSGPILDQLDKLKSGQVIQLRREDGRQYFIANWDDVVSETSDCPPSGQ